MASIWFKVLQRINEVNVMLQARQTTIDVEVENLSQLVIDLKEMRLNWDQILNECKLVAAALQINPVFAVKRKTHSHSDQTNVEENEFKTNTFFVIIDSVVEGIDGRFRSLTKLNDIFNFLWLFPSMDEDDVDKAATKFVDKYNVDVSKDLVEEIMHLKHIYSANFEENAKPIDLLNAIVQKNLNSIFSNVCVALRIFCTLPVSVASAERSFSALSKIKNAQRSCSTQTRLSGLGTLCIESELARKLNFEDLINSFAAAKARKARLI